LKRPPNLFGEAVPAQIEKASRGEPRNAMNARDLDEIRDPFNVRQLGRLTNDAEKVTKGGRAHGTPAVEQTASAGILMGTRIPNLLAKVAGAGNACAES
jgi:hypothetical protein